MPKRRVSEPVKTQEEIDVTALNKLSVPLTPLRLKLAEMMRADIFEYPLGDLMLLIKEILHTKEEE